MTNDSLRDFISRYNEKNWTQPYSDYRIHHNVVLAKIWSDREIKGVSNLENDLFYFIESNQKAVGVVFLMGCSDLHWYVIESERKKGYLSTALKEAIFPHIFMDGRREQIATYDSAKNKAYLVRLGFSETERYGRDVCVLKKEQVSKFDNSNIIRTPLRATEIDSLRNELFHIARQIRVVRDKLYCAYGDQDDCPIELYASCVNDLGLDLEFTIDDMKDEAIN